MLPEHYSQGLRFGENSFGLTGLSCLAGISQTSVTYGVSFLRWEVSEEATPKYIFTFRTATDYKLWAEAVRMLLVCLLSSEGSKVELQAIQAAASNDCQARKLRDAHLVAMKLGLEGLPR